MESIEMISASSFWASSMPSAVLPEPVGPVSTSAFSNGEGNMAYDDCKGAVMPRYTVTLEIARPVPDMFAYFTKPRNLAQFTPPDYNLELVTGPEVLALGERIVWQGRRWGVTQKLIQEVATFDLEKLIVVEQKQGPFKRWVQAHHFEPSTAGTRIIEKIDYEPPGGMLGFIVTANSIRSELENVTAYRAKKLAEIFGGVAPRER